MLKLFTHSKPKKGRYCIESHSVDCSDQGADFVEAKVDVKLDDLLSQRLNFKTEVLDDLIPCPLGALDEFNDPLLSVQVSAFSCGGFAIAVCSSHRIADMSTTMSLINVWTIAAKQELGYIDETCLSISFNFDSSSLFPLKMLPGLPSGLSRDKENIEVHKIVTKMFYFSKSKISSIRERARLDDSSMLCTRVQSVFGLIGKAIIDVHVANPENPKTFTLLQAVNMRKRTVPPLPQNQFGNLYLTAIVQSEVGTERVLALGSFVDCLSKAVKGVVDACGMILSLGEEGQTMISQGTCELMKSLSDPNIYFAGTFSSWCKFPFYEADFGWGKPIWVSIPNVPMKNTVVLIDDKAGEGIEAWVCMDENDMQKFIQHSDIADILSEL
ncbi:pelargonidin 3-O-(6-caffeoylglucoside) 5-O-(6-O-malonylglucoside) 4'''-malonyltransferase-like [Apium graveolens]|uniref:pelargonidin 3-O-(6-caffeoylglucoside) 5-O-(6-O-malonylglucoside) 4'''-malonyltransferase-like n=1 Tax=Apium graveolens TaxID=4045 RepID=UPI003D798509